MSKYIYIALVAIVGFLYYQNNSLIDEVKNQKLISASAINANYEWQKALNNLSDDYSKGLKALNDIKQQKHTEIRYIQNQKQNDNSCIDAINSIYRRLQQTTNNNNATNPQKPNINQTLHATKARLE